MFRLLQILRMATTGAALLQALRLQQRLKDIRGFFFLLAFSYVLAILLAGVFLGGVYLALVRYAGYDAETAFAVMSGGLVVVALAVFGLTCRRARRLRNITEVCDIEKQAFTAIGAVFSSFMDGFSETVGRKDL